ncbi:imidazole glycerol phosphate synthase subunit HisF [bacterium]|nr:imidazole glycerol phosphate synthase subunit HisF [bacterium]
MLKRVIPVLLLSNRGLVKTQKFGSPKYVGDPINAVKIFSEKEADELVFLDINASKNGTEPDYALVKDIASEAYMPFAYGGGITDLGHADKILKNGAEKVVLNEALFSHPELASQLIQEFGASTVVGCVNVKKDPRGEYGVYSHKDSKIRSESLVEHLKRCADLGLGEIILQSVDQDGLMQGYDSRLISLARPYVNAPLVALGGAGKLPDITSALAAGADAAAAGSLFTFYGKYRAVLITYPSYQEIRALTK